MSIENYEYISGELFSKISDVSIYKQSYLDTYPNIRSNCNKIIYYNSPISDNIIQIINGSKIFFVKTDHLDYFTNKIMPLIKHKFILVTHNADYLSGINNKIISNPMLLKWYGQNMILNEKTQGIPIGLENSQWKGHDYNICKINRNNKKEKLLYFNFSLTSNPNRKYIEEIFINNGFVKNKKMEWPNYIKELSQYIFCISPEGNGPDCHRLWECIYVGCIPIVKKNPIMYHHFKELPILWVDNYNNITKKFLENLVVTNNINDINIDKSRLDYWIKEFDKQLK